MRDITPFPNGHNPRIEIDHRFVCTGTLFKDLKGKELTLKAITEGDILEIRDMLLEEERKQNLEE